MNTRIEGNTGEDMACIFLRKKGFNIVCRNYAKKWGEIDIIGIKDKMYHFFEVKSINIQNIEQVNHFRPEENVHGLKLKHVGRMIETYFEHECEGNMQEFCFHVLCVYMDRMHRRARVKWIENVIL